MDEVAVYAKLNKIFLKLANSDKESAMAIAAVMNEIAADYHVRTDQELPREVAQFKREQRQAKELAEFTARRLRP